MSRARQIKLELSSFTVARLVMPLAQPPDVEWGRVILVMGHDVLVRPAHTAGR
jgi:hypothetical protein